MKSYTQAIAEIGKIYFTSNCDNDLISDFQGIPFNGFKLQQDNTDDDKSLKKKIENNNNKYCVRDRDGVALADKTNPFVLLAYFEKKDKKYVCLLSRLVGNDKRYYVFELCEENSTALIKLYYSFVGIDKNDAGIDFIRNFMKEFSRYLLYLIN